MDRTTKRILIGALIVIFIALGAVAALQFGLFKNKPKTTTNEPVDKTTTGQGSDSSLAVNQGQELKKFANYADFRKFLELHSVSMADSSYSFNSARSGARGLDSLSGFGGGINMTPELRKKDLPTKEEKFNFFVSAMGEKRALTISERNLYLKIRRTPELNERYTNLTALEKKSSKKAIGIIANELGVKLK